MFALVFSAILMAPFNSLKGAFALKRSSLLWNSVAQKEGQNFSDLALLSEVNRSSSRKNTKGRKCLRNELFNEAKQLERLKSRIN